MKLSVQGLCFDVGEILVAVPSEHFIAFSNMVDAISIVSPR